MPYYLKHTDTGTYAARIGSSTSFKFVSDITRATAYQTHPEALQARGDAHSWFNFPDIVFEDVANRRYRVTSVEEDGEIIVSYYDDLKVAENVYKAAMTLSATHANLHEGDKLLFKWNIDSMPHIVRYGDTTYRFNSADEADACAASVLRRGAAKEVTVYNKRDVVWSAKAQ